MKNITVFIISMLLLTSCFWNKQKDDDVVNDDENTKNIVTNDINNLKIETTLTWEILSQTWVKIENEKKEVKKVEKVNLKDSLDIEIKSEKLWEYDYHIVWKTKRKFKDIQVVWKNNKWETDKPYSLKKYNKETGEFEYNIKQNFKNVWVWSNIYIFTWIDDSWNIFVEEIEINVAWENVFLDKEEHYSKDLINVYYEWKIIEWANPLTFWFVWNVCNWNYEYWCWGKDNNNVYVGGKKVEWANPNNMKYIKSSRVSSLGGYFYMYLKDNNNIYITYWNKIKWADVNSFEIVKCLGWYYGSCYAKDKNSVYYYDTKLQWVNPNNFKLLDCLDAWEWAGYCYIVWDSKVFLWTEEIKWADANSFSYIYWSNWKILNWLKRDKYNVYDWINKIPYADPDSFKIIDCSDEMWWYGCFYKDKNNVYLNLNILKWADPNTFKVIGYKGPLLYSKDKNNIYYDDKKIEKSDPNTFKFLDNWYSQDKNNIYYNWVIIQWVDIKSVIFVKCENSYCDKNYLKDKNHVYCNWVILDSVIPEKFKIINSHLVYWENYVYSNCNKLEWVDHKTFESIWYSYYKDKNHVYYDQYKKLEGADSSSFGLVYNNSGGYSWYAKDKYNVYYKWNIIKWIDINTFSSYNWFSKDKNNLYINGEIVSWIDAKSVKILSSSNYIKDNKNIYYLSNDKIKVVEWADFETFNTVGPIFYAYWGSYDAKDKDNIYSYWSKINEKNFIEKVRKEWYSKDSNYVYYYRNILSSADINSFEILNDAYAKDKNNAYCYGQIINKVDVKTFTALEKWYVYAKDKNNVFYWEDILFYADSITFSVVWCDNSWRCYAKDKDLIFYWKKILDFADVNSFVYLWNNYTKDKNNAYYNWDILSNTNTFIYLNNWYWKDENKVYYNWKIIEWADSNSFNIIYDEFGKPSEFYKDKVDIYFFWSKFEWVDLDSFKVLSKDYTLDKNNVYNWKNIIEKADSNTFKIISSINYWAKDKNYVYYNWKILVWANPEDY